MKEQPGQPRGYQGHSNHDSIPNHLSKSGASPRDDAKIRECSHRKRGRKERKQPPGYPMGAPRFPRADVYRPRHEGNFSSQPPNDENLTKDAMQRQIDEVMRRENDIKSKRIEDLLKCSRDERLERDTLAQRLEDARSNLAANERRLAEAEKEISEGHKRFEKTIRKLEERDTQIAASKERVCAHSPPPPPRQPSVVSQRHIQDANNEVRRLQNRLGEAEFSKAHFTSTISKLQSDLKTMTSKFEVRTKQLNESSEEIFKEKGLAKEATALCDHLREELKEIRGKFSKKEKALEAADSEMKRLRMELSKSRIPATQGPQASFDRKKGVEEARRENTELKAANEKMAEELRLNKQETRAAKDLASTLEIRRNGDAAEMSVLRSKIDELLSNEGKTKKELKKSKEVLAAKHKQLKNALSLLSSMNDDDDDDLSKHNRNADTDDDEEQKIEEPPPKKIKVEEYPGFIMLD